MSPQSDGIYIYCDTLPGSESSKVSYSAKERGQSWKLAKLSEHCHRTSKVPSPMNFTNTMSGETGKHATRAWENSPGISSEMADDHILDSVAQIVGV